MDYWSFYTAVRCLVVLPRSTYIVCCTRGDITKYSASRGLASFPGQHVGLGTRLVVGLRYVNVVDGWLVTTSGHGARLGTD